MELLVVAGALDTCGDGTCAAYTQGSTSLALDAGEEITLVVDGLNAIAGAYTLTVTCPCAQELQP
jgi:hypothetical protein